MDYIADNSAEVWWDGMVNPHAIQFITSGGVGFNGYRVGAVVDKRPRAVLKLGDMAFGAVDLYGDSCNFVVRIWHENSPEARGEREDRGERTSPASPRRYNVPSTVLNPGWKA
jgi:hypothetical protein